MSGKERDEGILHISRVKGLCRALGHEPESKEQLIQPLKVARRRSLLDNNALGYFPKRGRTVDIGRYRFKAPRADSRTIHLLNVRLLPSG